MEAKKREMINEERTVIDEDLIIQAVLEERKYNLDETIPDLKVEEDVNLDKIDSLSLTHKKIFSISNLDGFNLRKLVLNSNIIEKIEGLDHLVNLEWLDLSFNRISKIEGLDNLVNLKDLSLHKNKITKVEGLDNLKKLQILSLGENEISSMGVFQDLRKFKSLRVVNLRGNPVSRNDSYISSVIAFLPHVQYLDFKLLQPTPEQKDYYPSDLDRLVKDEKKNAEEQQIVEEKEAFAKKDSEVNVSGMRTLYDDMLAQDKFYADTISIFHGIAGFKQEVMIKYKNEFKKAVEDYLSECQQLYEMNVKERERLREVIAGADSKSKKLSVEIIQEFEALKESAIQEYNLEMDPRVLEDLSAEIKNLEGKLMDNEMLLAEQLGDLFEEFNIFLRKSKEQSNAKRSDFTLRIQEIVEGYQTKLQEFVDKEKDRIEEDEEDEDEVDEDELDDMTKLLKNDEKLKEAISGSHSMQKDFIDELVGAHTREEEARIKKLQTQLQLENYNKNRNRVAEIFDVVDLYRKVIKMCEMVDDDEDEEEEDDDSAT